MTSPMTQLQKPALPPKPVKYRAPPPPTCPVQSAVPCSNSSAPSSSSSSVRRQLPASKKYRAPAPPTVRPPAPPSTSNSPSAGKPTMRREPMQVCLSGVASYDRGQISSASMTPAMTVISSTTSDDVVINGPRSFKNAVDSSSNRQFQQQDETLNESTDSKMPDNNSANNNSLTADRLEADNFIVDVATIKPVVHDVKLCPRHSAITLSTNVEHQLEHQLRTWRSTESIDRLITSATVSGTDGTGSGRSAMRSSFLDPSTSAGSTSASGARRSVYIDLGEYQTLLKHGRQDAVYSLPQPHCYGNETLRAVKLITEKYDTFKRRQLRAKSFCDATGAGATRTSRQQSSSSDGNTIAEGDEGEGAVNSTLNSSDNKPTDSRDMRDTPTTVQPMTLSRSVVTLSRSALNSASSMHDVTYPLEIELADDSDMGVTRTDRLRIEMFYRSRETNVYVCSCLADLFVGALAPSGAAGRWVHVHTGVPVWMLNSGQGRRRRELVIVVAERQTGLPLWQDRITYLSNYAQADDGDANDYLSHVMRPSSNLSSAVRITMFNRRSATAFLDCFHRFTADPVDDLWKISTDRSSADSHGGWLWKCGWRRRHISNELPPSKDSISQPCHVIHMSRVDVRHPNFRTAFAHLLPPLPSSPQTATASSAGCPVAMPQLPAGQLALTVVAETDAEEFRPRLPTR